MKDITIVLDHPINENEIHVSQIASITNGSCDNLNLRASMDYTPHREALLSAAIGKVKYGGTITISGLDAFEVSRQIYVGKLNGQQASEILYKNINGHTRSSCGHILDTIDKLQQHNFTILIKELQDYAYSIQARRNEPHSHIV